MPVIFKEESDKFRILDPFYAGEWQMDREATYSYLKFLAHNEKLSPECLAMFKEYVKMVELPEPFRTFIVRGLPLTCDFSIEKVMPLLAEARDGIVTPPIPIFEITPLCNYGCPWCFIPREKRTRLGLDTIREKLVKPLLQRGTRVFVLTGGEPSMELSRLGNICKLIDEEASKLNCDVKIALLTNGYKLASNAKLYKQLGISSIQVSVISTDSKLDSQLRCAPIGIDSAKEAFLGTEIAVKEGIDVSYNFVLLPSINGLPSNIREIPAMVAYAKRLGVYMIRIVPVVQSGEAYKNRICLTFEELRFSRDLINEEIKRSEEGFIVYSPIGYEVPASKPVYCRAGNDVLYVNAEGWVYPCNNLICPEFRCNDAPIGKLDIMYVWDNSKVLSQFRSPTSVCNSCLKCNLRTECGGQCRAQIYSKHRQIDLSNPPTKCYGSERAIA